MLGVLPFLRCKPNCVISIANELRKTPFAQIVGTEVTLQICMQSSVQSAGTQSMQALQAVGLNHDSQFLHG